MSDPRPEELIQAEQLMYETKFDEALELIRDIERKKVLSTNQQLSSLNLKGKLYVYKKLYNKARKMGDQAYLLSQKLGNLSESIDALILKSYIQDPDKALDLILEAEELLGSQVRKTSSDLSVQRADILYRKSWIYTFKFDYGKALKLALQCLELREKGDNQLRMAYSMRQICRLLLRNMRKSDEALDYAMKSLEILKKFGNNANLASILCLVGEVYAELGEYDQAIKFFNQSLSIKDIRIETKITIFSRLGLIAYNRGEFEKALKNFKQAALYAEDSHNTLRLAENLAWVGGVYSTKGDYEQAIKHLERSLTLIEKTYPFAMELSLYWLVTINLDKNFDEKAQMYLRRYKKLADQIEQNGPRPSVLYRLAKARVLKKGGRTRDRAEAEKLLKEVIEARSTTHAPSFMGALFTLCDLYLEELEVYNDLDIISEITPLITRLLNISEKEHSYWWLASALFLQAKLTLIQIDIPKTQELLIKAQNIAESHGIQYLARMISKEHDRLLEQINLWNTLKKRNAPVSERLKLSSIKGVLERLQGRHVVEPLELVEEIPVLLAIVSKTGYIILIHPFSTEIPFDESRVGEFVSFFNSISSQMFSKALDRAKFGEFTLLLKIFDSITFCYLFEGQSYMAQRRINAFYNAVGDQASIMSNLNTAVHTGKSITLEENPELEALIAENFLSDPKKFKSSADKEELHKLIKRSRRIRKQRAIRNQKVSRIVITETLIEIISLILFITSHLLFLGYRGDLKAAWIIPGDRGFLLYVDLTLYLGTAGHLIVLNIMIIYWLNETRKNTWIKRGILAQIAALVLFLAAQLLYLSFLGILPPLDLTAYEYATIVDIPFYLGIACQLIVIVLILYDYMKHQ